MTISPLTPQGSENPRNWIRGLLNALGIREASDRAAAAPLEAFADQPEELVRLAAGSPQRIGSLLLGSGRLRATRDVDETLAEQKYTGERFGEVLVRKGKISSDERDIALSFQRNQRGAPEARSELRLGEILVARGDITREQLKDALARQKQSGRQLGDELVE